MEIAEITTGDIIRHCHFLKSTCDIGDPRQGPQSNPNPRLAWLTCVMESPNSTTFGQPHEAAFFKLLVTLAMFIPLPDKYKVWMQAALINVVINICQQRPETDIKWLHAGREGGELRGRRGRCCTLWVRWEMTKCVIHPESKDKYLALTSSDLYIQRNAVYNKDSFRDAFFTRIRNSREKTLLSLVCDV